MSIADSGGRVVISKDGVVEIDYTGDTLLTADTTIDTVRISKVDSSSSSDIYFQYLLVDAADISLKRVVDDVTSINGGFQDWDVGAENNIDDHFANPTTASFNTASTAGQGGTYDMENLTSIFPIVSVDSILLTTHAKPDADPALYMKPRVRISATNYDGTGIQNLAGVWTPYYWRYDTDPSTASAWANVAAVDAAELGVVFSATS